MKVVSVQHIDITLTGTTQTAAIPAPVSDLSRSVVVGSWEISDLSGYDIGAQQVQCTLEIINASTVQIQRNGTDGTITATVSVIEFASDVTVQKGTYSIATGATVDTVAISAVDLSKSWLVAYERNDEVGSIDYHDSTPSSRLVSFKLSSTTSIDFARESGQSGNIDGVWFVVSATSSIVSQHTTLFTNGDTTINPGRTVLLANTMLLSSMRTTESAFNGKAQYRASLLSQTEIQYTNYRSAYETVESQLVDSTDIDVQHFDIINTQISTGTQAISAIDLSRSVVLSTAQTGIMSGAEYATGTLDSRYFRFSFDDAQTVAWDRGSNGADSSLSYQVIEFDVSNGQPITITDTALGSDQLSSTVALSIIDNAQGIDASPPPSVVFTLSDVATGADAVAVLSAVVKTVIDSAQGTDLVQSVAASLQVADETVGADALNLFISMALTDTASSSDLSHIIAAVSAIDTGTGLDSLSIASQLSVADIALGNDSESILVSFTLVDTGAGQDSANVLADTIKTITDFATGSDAITGLLVSVPVSDTASMSDHPGISVQLAITDSGAGMDAISTLQAVIKTINDMAVGHDQVANVTVNVPVFDAATGTDAMSHIQALLQIIDSAGGSDMAVAFDSQTSIAKITFTMALRQIVFAMLQRSMTFQLNSN